MPGIVRHVRRRWRPALLAGLACALLLIAACGMRLAPIAVASAAPLAVLHVANGLGSVAPTPGAAVRATPTPAGQPAFSCTASWCGWIDTKHWWLLGGPLILVAGLVLLLAMRAEMRVTRAGSRRAKSANKKEARKAARKAARRAAWARLLRRKPPVPPTSPIWGDLPDEMYRAGPLLPPAAPGWPRAQRSGASVARLPTQRGDDRR